METRVGPQRQKLALSQTVPWPEKLKHRGDVAVRAAEKAEQAYRKTQLNLFYRVKVSFIDPLLDGGTRTVKVPDKDGVFEGREIVLGPRAGDYYLVRKGLKPGEQVVVHGNFKIDSAVQILAKPSMMGSGGMKMKHHQH